jgi:acetyltransferase
LKGYRDLPPANMEAIVSTLISLSDLVVDIPELVELDINPLLADENGVIALDARVVVRFPSDMPDRHMAIRPYPAGLSTDFVAQDGRRIALRPIRPEDERLVVAMVRSSKPEDLRLRFFGAIKELPHELAARFSQIDYDREMAFIALDASTRGPVEELLGIARLVADPNNEAAEFAVMVRSDVKRQGLGYRLMTELLKYAKARGLQRVWGQVLRENTTMLEMAKELGGAVVAHDGDPHSVVVEFEISTGAEKG